MPAQADGPKEPRRRVKRPPRRTAKSSVTNVPSSNGVETDVRADSTNGAFQPTQILQRGEVGLAPTSGNLSPTHPAPSPLPQRPQTTGEGDRARRKKDNDSLPKPTQRRKNKPTPPHAKHTNVSQTPTRPSTASKSSTPDAFLSRPANATPSKAYAGPTFHASPAASSLPLPKFFSKSVPNVDKSTSLKHMLEHDSLESTSENDSSPFQDTDSPLRNHRLREGSPLDIFFQADKDAKAKGALATANGQTTNEPANLPNGTKTSYDFQTERRPRNHSRHHTDSSSAGVFPFEMNAPTSNTLQQQLKSTQHMNLDICNEASASDASTRTEQERLEEQRQAQSLALKQLLRSPGSQRSTPPPIQCGYQSADAASPSSRPRSGDRSSARVSNTQAHFLKGLDTPPAQRQAALLATTERQIASSNNHTGQRPSSSGLSKEVAVHPPSVPALPPDMPLTSTPPNKYGRTTPSDKSHFCGAAHDGVVPTYPPSIPPSNRKINLSNATNGSGTNLKLMEDDLRRILKLDALSNDRVAGARS